jgi:hypothetical protein
MLNAPALIVAEAATDRSQVTAGSLCLTVFGGIW